MTKIPAFRWRMVFSMSTQAICWKNFVFNICLCVVVCDNRKSFRYEKKFFIPASSSYSLTESSSLWLVANIFEIINFDYASI